MPMAKQLDAWHFAWNGGTYRGDFAYVPLGGGEGGLVGTLPLDSYLYGVVGSGVSPAWPREAQKAQAIVARSYVMLRLGADKAYDIVATDGDQRYGGMQNESVEGRAAVDSTAGKVVNYNRAPARVAYSACCGGRTSEAADIGGSSVPYMRSFPDPYCADTLYHHWEVRVPYASIASRLDLTRAGSLRSVQVGDFDGSMRPRHLTFAGSAATVDIGTLAFQVAAGASVVHSCYLHSVIPSRDELVVAGNGSGHGVGLCQWGARTMATQGASAAEILAFYFPKTAIGSP